MYVIVGTTVGTTIFPNESCRLPAYENIDGPLPSNPPVTTYCTVMTAPFSSFLPKIPSPNKSSYLSS